MRLTTLYGQFRAVGVNYNQIVKILYRIFLKRKPQPISFKLENKRSSWQLCRAITQLTEEFELKHLKKEKMIAKIGANIIGALSIN
jgi:hypothetical protein